MKEVIIGIVSKHYKKEVSQFKNTFIRDEVKQAVFDNGAIAIGILPTCFPKVVALDPWKNTLTQKEELDLIEQIKLCDGIILQGGGFSDEYECYIAKYCYDHNIPILGICAGNNNLVRAVGGKIAKLEDIAKHRSLEPYVHEISIDPESMLFNIIKKKKIMVNSRHQYYTVDPGILKPVAYSEDGIIEAVEDPKKLFYFAVQFHPESLYKTDENMNRIFKRFIEICNFDK